MILYEGGGSCLPCNAIWRPVETLPSLDEASRNHAYVLPDNSIWVLNHDGTGFVTADKSSIMVKSEDNSIECKYIVCRLIGINRIIYL